MFVLAVVGGFLVSLVRYGPVKAGEITYRTLTGGVAELTRISPRKVLALAGLAIKESLRRRVLVALVVFAGILLFASWYLRTDNLEPARLYLSFVLTATSYLILLLSLLLAAFSLPNDMKQKTIYTIVTKPVRPGDIVLGRMLGFIAIGTMLLAVMAVASWVFVQGSLAHEHTVESTLTPLLGPDGERVGQQGRTSFDLFHRHDLAVDSDGIGLSDAANGHWHEVDTEGDRLVVGPATGYLRARVPQRGKLQFLDRQGVPVARGISVGYEWGYRSFIQGASQAAAIWTFDGVTESTLMEFEDGSGLYLPIELIVRVYRSYQGNIEQAIQGTIQLSNPETGVKTMLEVFSAEDAKGVNSFEFANEQTSTDQQEITILDDLVTDDGRIEVVVQCLDRGQYFGFAQADCFLRRPEGSPLWNFVKGYLAIWMQMVIVVAVAVAASTFLSGPIAMVVTVAFILLGFYRDFFVDIALGDSYGGGPVESLVRLVTQMNVMSPFDRTPAVDAMKAVDYVLQQAMQAVSYVLPDFSAYLGRVNFVAEGFSIPGDAVLRDLTVCLAYVVGLAVAGGEMNQRNSLTRKVAYGVAIVLLLFPLSYLSAPATVAEPGGKLAQLRTANQLSQADLGEIDPASETIKLATLGLRGLAVNLLWDRATHYKKVEDWTNLAATLEQLAKLQPNFVTFWKYQSWNLSYNVSVEFDDYKDRYYWVRRGIQFLQKGVTYNRDSPQLLWELGWVLGQKIGRSDEKVQYRRLFKADEEFHPEDRPPADRDNWLVSKEAYLESVAAVDERGKSLGKKSPSIFYSSPSKSQMNYSAAIEDEGLFQKAVAGWEVAEREWREFGNLQIEHSTGKFIRFNDEDDLTERVAELNEQLKAMGEDVEAKAQADARASLTDAQREAYDTPAEDRTDEQNELYYQARNAMKIDAAKLAAVVAQMSPEKERQARELAAELMDTEQSLRFVRAYKGTTNYDYWATRCAFEQTKAAVTARELVFRARRLFREEGDPVGAKEAYETSFNRWAEVFEEFPQLKDGEDTTGDDVMVFIYEFNRVLEQLDEEIPDDFPLWEIIESFDSEGEFTLQLREREQAASGSDASAAASGGEEPAFDETPAAEAGADARVPAVRFSRRLFAAALAATAAAAWCSPQAGAETSLASRLELRLLTERGPDREPEPTVVTAVAISADGTRVLAGGDGHRLRVWDAESGAELATLDGHGDWVRSACFLPKSDRLASVAADHSLHVWATDATPRRLAERRLADGALQAVAMHPDGHRLATTGFGDALRLFDLDGPADAKPTEYGCACEDTRAVAFSPDGRWMAAAGRNGVVRMWDLVASGGPRDLPSDGRRVRALAFSPDGETLAAGGDGPAVRLWRVDTRNAAFDDATIAPDELLVRPGKVHSLAFLDDRTLAVGGTRNTIQLWDAETRSERGSLRGHTGTVAALAASEDGRRLVSGSFDATVRVWDVDPTRLPAASTAARVAPDAGANAVSRRKLVGLISTLFRRPSRPLAKAPRRSGVEPLEQRQMLAADVLLGAVYYEESTGEDTQPDILHVSFVGGAEGTTLDRLVISGDKAGDGFTVNDVFFDIDPAQPGDFAPVGFSLVESDGFEVTGVSVSDGSTDIVFTFDGFDAGETLVFSIDVDEFDQVDPTNGDPVFNATAEGAEFQFSNIVGDFSAPGHVDLQLSGTYYDFFDDLRVDAESDTGLSLGDLPDDDYESQEDDPVRTAGAVAHAPQLELATLSGFVYHDRDDDGLREPGQSEEPIADVTVELLDASGAVIGATTTDTNGFYEFVDLEQGVYSVRETQPAGWFDGKDTAGSEGGTVTNDLISLIDLDYGEHSVNNNFGELLGATIGGRVHAMDGPDCDFDNPDVLLEGVTIELLNPAGQVIATTTTNAQGRYQFTGLRPGEYQVRERQPEGYYDGGERVGTAGGTLSDDLISGIVVGSEENATQYDFCEHIGADLSGYVYHDRSNDGIKDPGEEPIAGVTLKLLKDGVDTGRTAVTDASGYYEFTNLDRGKYAVMEIHPEGWIDGLDTEGNLGGSPDNPGDMISQIMLDYGDDAVEYNFGELLPGSIAGRVHASMDGDCDFDDPDVLLEGVTIQLLNADGEQIAETTTNAQGEYLFDNLPPGKYSVREIQPEGFYDGSERVGTAGGVLSNDLISQIDLGSEQAAVNYDFCEHVGARLSGFVYHDRSDDGIRDTGEEAIAGVTIELLDASGEVIGTTTTDSAGFYEFVDLTAGIYTVRETQPVGWFDGKDTEGTTGGVATNDLISSIPLEFGDDSQNNNFGELLGATIGGRVHAMDGPDCDFDNPDVLLEGVTIELLNPAGQVIATTTTNAQGRYQFTGLRPGEYQVRERQPEGYYDGGERVGTAGGTLSDDLISGIVVGSEENATQYDFCEHIGADLSGYVYHDRSNDGIKDPGEEPIAGVTLKLLKDGEDTGQRAVTDESGFYQFTNLDRGEYCVMEVHPEGWIDGLDTAGNLGGEATNPGDMICEITLDYGDDAVEYNFGELLPGSIGGLVHSSTEPDCIDDPNAMPIAGVTIELLDESGAVIRTTTTDADGRYLFDNLPPGKYGVREIQPEGYFDGGEIVGEKGGGVSDDLFTGINVGSAEDVRGYHFCETPPSALAGYVFIDGAPIVLAAGQTLPEDVSPLRDGVRTSDDTPLAGVVVRLVNGATGNPFYRVGPGESFEDVPEGFAGIEVLPGYYEDGVFEVLTDARGYYEFNGLPSGSYAVVEIGPTGLADGVDTPGSTGGVAVNPGDPDTIPIRRFEERFGNDVLFNIPLGVGEFSVENNFSEVRTTPLIPPTPEDPPLPPFVPPTAITPGPPPALFPLTILDDPLPEGFGGSDPVGGYTWHLSVINGGQPRAVTENEARMLLTSQSEASDEWDGADRDEEELRRARWLLLASDVEGADLSELLFGIDAAIPVAGDWDGDGVTDIGVFLNGDWYLDLNGNGRWDRDDLWAKLGTGEDLPVTGDWDGDGKTDIGIYGPAWARDPHAIRHEPGIPDVANWPTNLEDEDGEPKLKNMPPIEEEATLGARLMRQPTQAIKQFARRADLIDHVFHYGAPGDAPVAGDWNGDGLRTIGVFRDGLWTLDTDGDGRLETTDRQVVLGQPGDKPVVGDFDGDGVDDLGVYRGGEWLTDLDGDGELEAMDEAFARDQTTPTGEPIVGDWDGDGRDEPGVYTPTGETAPAEEVRVSQRQAG
ncbi:unnamed protein product [Cladocopium goreaui]|uniref:Serine-aspartate repeat-containing protein D n=1 Tax=Cladocopium goreaui TaxID=2562237 RepID=A0A9P1G351_9DINO|nr:unnamed protein product [Cladocopium goreaui]